MSGNVQCPNCGGYKITEKKEEIKEKVSSTRPYSVKNSAKGFIIVAAYILGTTLCISAGGGLGAKGIGTVLVLGGIVFILWIVFAIVRMPMIAQKERLKENFTVLQEKVVATKYYYYCHICGKSWTWQSGQPRPLVTVRPDLIAKARLAETWTCIACSQPNSGSRESCLICGTRRPG